METPGAVNNNDNGSTMMIEALQDSLLISIYKGLPELLYAIFILNHFCKFTFLSASYVKLSHLEKWWLKLSAPPLQKPVKSLKQMKSGKHAIQAIRAWCDLHSIDLCWEP